jgi:hypothetical protein
MLSTYASHFEDVSVYFIDGSPTPLITQKLMDYGDLSVDGLTPELREVVRYERKGKLQTSRYGKRKYPKLKLSCIFAEFSEAVQGTFYDMVHATPGSAFAARRSTYGLAPGAVLALDIKFVNETSVAGGVDSGLYLHDCTFDDISYEKGEPDKMSISITVEGGVDGSFDSIFGVNLAEGP